MRSTLAMKTASLIAGAESDEAKLKRIFLFVRDEIQFNWAYPQDIPSEEVFANGMGVCMQKANLLGAMAREAGFTTRFRFMYVHKQALEDFLPAFAYKNWVDPFPHTVAEVKRKGEWISFDPSFDKGLYDVCIKQNLNFAKYPEIRGKYSLYFSPEGVVGAQEYWAVSSLAPFYGEDLSPLMAFEKHEVNFLKRLLKPLIFAKARKIMTLLRAAQ